MNRLAVRNLRSFSVQPVLNLTFRLFFLQLYTFYIYSVATFFQYTEIVPYTSVFGNLGEEEPQKERLSLPF